MTENKFSKVEKKFETLETFFFLSYNFSFKISIVFCLIFNIVLCRFRPFFTLFSFHSNVYYSPKTSSLPRNISNVINFFFACRILFLLRRKVQTVVVLLSCMSFSKSIDPVCTPTSSS